MTSHAPIWPMRDTVPAHLVGFLYLLMRDELPAGTIAQLMENHLRKVGTKTLVFTNPHLEAYAREIAAELVR